jgi:hypothetical protein
MTAASLRDALGSEQHGIDECRAMICRFDLDEFVSSVRLIGLRRSTVVCSFTIIHLLAVVRRRICLHINIYMILHKDIRSPPFPL